MIEDIKSYGVIYPEIKVLRAHGNIYALTTVRRKHEGKWYLQDFLQIQYMRSASQEVLMEAAIAIDRLHKSVYQHLQLGCVDTNMVDVNRNPINILDANQEEEVVRLERLAATPNCAPPSSYIDLSDD